MITGGGSGIGLEAAKQFLQIGAKVIITGRNQTKLEAAKKAYPALVTIKSDVSKAEDAQDLYEQIKSLGGIDILYNNAGVGVPPLNLGIASDKHVEGAVYEMEVNYFGVVRLNNLFIEMLKSRKDAAIINTTSLLSIVPSILEATYSASKTALAFYTKSLRKHLQIIGSNVKVFELLPPLVDTDIVADRKDKKLVLNSYKGLMAGLENGQHTIRIGDTKTKAIYLLNCIAPRTAYNIINSSKDYHSIKKHYL